VLAERLLVTKVNRVTNRVRIKIYKPSFLLLYILLFASLVLSKNGKSLARQSPSPKFTGNCPYRPHLLRSAVRFKYNGGSNNLKIQWNITMETRTKGILRISGTFSLSARPDCQSMIQLFCDIKYHSANITMSNLKSFIANDFCFDSFSFSIKE